MPTDSGPETGPRTRLVAGRYALSEVLGRGGMGTVWRATDRVLEREVALKEVTFAVDLTAGERAILRERTLREARAAARLDHPCVAAVYDVVEEDGRPWLVMEHVSARSLQDILESEGPLPPADVARIGLDVLSALEAAHGAGIVHRDVKPANVLVEPDGHARLTDFGIATTTGDSSLTTGGALIGSPSYMAPERAYGDEPRPPVDLWSLGATLYAAVEGRPPFARGEPMATMLAVVSEHPAPMLRAGPLEPVLQGLLTKDPAARSDAARTRELLSAVLAGGTAGPPTTAAPPPAPASLPAASMERLDVDDLRALASASKALVTSVARDARDQARSLVERRRERKGDSGPVQARSPAAPPAAPRRRRRFKRRWVVVPVLVTVTVVLLVLVGLGFLVATLLGLT